MSISLVNKVFYRDKKTRKALSEFVLKADQLSIGKEVESFEKEFADWQGRKYCVMFNSGSSANLALVQALINLGYIKQGDKAGHSAITWATNVMPLMQLGLDVVPIDVDLETLNVSKLEPMKVMFLTHLLGFCGDLEGVSRYCEENNIILLEDTCEALGSVYKGKKLGNWGLASTFSFFVGHHLSTIEGGAVCTDSYTLSVMLNMVRAHGWDRNLSGQIKSMIRAQYGINNKFFDNFVFYDLGYNLRPTEITGFLGRVQLEYADEIVKKRQKQFEKLAELISKNDDIISLDLDMDTISAFSIPLVFKRNCQKYIDRFKKRAEIRQIVGGCMPSQPFYKKYGPKIWGAPNAKYIDENGFYFTNRPDLTKKEIETLCQILQS